MFSSGVMASNTAVIESAQSLDIMLQHEVKEMFEYVIGLAPIVERARLRAKLGEWVATFGEGGAGLPSAIKTHTHTQWRI